MDALGKLGEIGQRTNFIHWIGIYPLDKVIHSSYNRAQSKNTSVYNIQLTANTPKVNNELSLAKWFAVMLLLILRLL